MGLRKNLTLTLACCLAAALMANIAFADAEKDIPEMTKLRSNPPELAFSYCYSCGYRKAFEDYTVMLVQKYPQLYITGSNYNPPGLNMYLSKIIFGIKILLIVVLVSSFDLFGSLGLPTPSWWRHLLENKLYACLMIFFIGNFLESQFVSSGAFEITLNDVPVWSKLQTGRIPSPQELFQIIDNQLQFSTKVQENPDFVK